MSDDLEIIAQLEKRIGKKLPLEKFKAHWGDVGYHLSNNNKIIGLSLYKCKLKQLPEEITQLRYLQKLYLTDNQLTQLPKEIAQLQNLQNLNLSDNRLTQLPKEITQLNLETGWQKVYPWEGIFLAGNPLQSPPPEIIEQGKQAVIDYFNALSQEKSPLNECKLLNQPSCLCKWISC